MKKKIMKVENETIKNDIEPTCEVEQTCSKVFEYTFVYYCKKYTCTPGRSEKTTYQVERDPDLCHYLHVVVCVVAKCYSSSF